MPRVPGRISARSHPGTSSGRSTKGTVEFVYRERFGKYFFARYVEATAKDPNTLAIEKCLEAVEQTITFGERRRLIMYQLAELLERGKATVLHPDSRDCWLALESAEHILSEMLSLSAFSGYSLEDGECYTGSCSGA